MKLRELRILVPALALGFVGCEKPEQPQVPAEPPAETAVTPPDAPPAPPPAPPPPVTPSLSAEERAAMLGFAKHLPADTEALVSIHNGSKTVGRIQGSKLWSVVESELGGGMMPGGFEPLDEMDLEDMDEDFELPEEQEEPEDGFEEPEIGIEIEEMDDDMEPMGPAKLFGSEFTIAVGKQTAAQTGHLLALNKRFSYFQMKTLAGAFAEAVGEGDMSIFEDAMDDSYNEEFFKSLVEDPEGGIGLLEKMAMPPLYLAFRTSDADRESAAQQIASGIEFLGMFEDMIEEVEIEQAGSTLTGYKVAGEKLSASMEEERESIEETLDPAQVDRLIAAVAKKDLVLVSGIVGDYVVLFVGSSADDFKLAASADDSLAGGDALKFCDAYVGKELAAVTYGTHEMATTLATAAGGLEDLTKGLRDGLAESGKMGDTRDLEELLRMVGERELALRNLATYGSGGAIAFFDDGLRAELHGGNDDGSVDWTAANRLAGLGDGDDVVMFANMATTAEYTEKSVAFLEALVETSYAIASKVAEAAGESEDLAQFQGIMQMFDGTFRADLLALWQAFRGDFSDGLGYESAMVVDFGGSMPTVPGVPQAVLDEARFPRVTWITPVRDRAKLAGSWVKMNQSITSILGQVSEMTGNNIPMQKPISSERDGFTTWFISLPFLNDEFMPSVTVGDEWFAASTSRIQALDLIAKADQADAAPAGVRFALNFDALRKFAQETVAVLEKNAEETGIDKDDLEKALKFVNATEELDRLTVHTRREGDKVRSSIHLKTK